MNNAGLAAGPKITVPPFWMILPCSVKLPVKSSVPASAMIVPALTKLAELTLVPVWVF